MQQYLLAAQSSLNKAKQTKAPEMIAFHHLDAINYLFLALPYTHNDKRVWSRVMTGIKASRKALGLAI